MRKKDDLLYDLYYGVSEIFYVYMIKYVMKKRNILDTFPRLSQNLSII